MVEQSRGVVRWEECPGIPTAGNFEPLRVTAYVPGPVFVPRQRVALDSMLAAKVCLLQDVTPASSAAHCSVVTVPLALDETDGFPLCSFSIGELVEAEKRYQNRRAPVDQYQTLAERKGTVNISSGADKGYHYAYRTNHLKDGKLTWFCLGKADAISFLLRTVRFVGKKTSTGYGKVERWDVELCAPWGNGFPVAKDGKPLRPLPHTYPGLRSPRMAVATLTYPYWDESKGELCAVPG